MTNKVIHAPWALEKIAEALGRTPGAIRTAICRGKFPLKPQRILGRVYFNATDVHSLLCSKGESHE